MWFVIVLVLSAIGALPLFVRGKFGTGTLLTVIYGAIFTPIIYFGTPSFMGPLFGVGALFIVLGWFVSAIIDMVQEECLKISALFPSISIVALLSILIYSCNAFHASEYSGLIGKVETREWTKDIQPKDPRHVRLVPKEHALFLARNQLGNAAGAIGSQFEISEDNTTLQMVNHDLCWIIPLDYSSWGSYRSTEGAPGYIKVDGEDPVISVETYLGEKYIYTPGAYFGKNLERHLWSNGYMTSGLTDYSFELDESRKAWWIVTQYHYTIGYSGSVIDGILKIDPITGNITPEKLGEIESWIDRAIPSDIINGWANDWGILRNGWENYNGFLGIGPATQKDCMQAEAPIFSYGSDGQPYQVSCMTSTNRTDTSLVGILYTNARTGKTTFYHAQGSTEEKTLNSINAVISFKKWHATDPVIYNIYGRMVGIAPVLSESGSWQGVGFCDMKTSQVAFGETLSVAIEEFEKKLGESNKQDAPELQNQTRQVEGILERKGEEGAGNSTTYSLVLAGIPKIFTCGAGKYAKLPVTHEGDKVIITYIDSPSEKLPILGFENLTLPINASPLQLDVRTQNTQRRAEIKTREDLQDAKSQIQNMTPEELRALLELRRKQKGN